MQKKVSLINSLSWSFAEQMLAKLVSLVVQLVLVRILDPEVFGVLAILLVVMQFADILSQGGLGLAIIQRSNVSSKDFSTAFWLCGALGLVLYIIAFFGAPLLADFYDRPGLTEQIRVISICVVINSLNSVQRSYMQREMRFKALSIVNTTGAILSGIVSIILALNGFGIWSLIAQVCIQAVVAFVLLIIVVPIKPVPSFSIKVARSLFSYGWKMSAAGIINTFYYGAVDLIVGKTCTIDDLGYYSQGRKWPVTATSILSNSIANVLFPAFSLTKDNMGEFRRIMHKSLVVSSFVVVPFSFLLFTSAPALISFFFTDKWLKSVWVFQMFSLSGSLGMMRVVNLRAYMAIGKSDLYLKLHAMEAGVGSIFVLIVCLTTHNINYAATMYCFINLLFSLCFLLPAKRHLGYSARNQIKEIAPALYLSILASLLCCPISYFKLPAIVTLVLQGSLFCIVYLLGSKIISYEGIILFGSIIKKQTHRIDRDRQK